MLRGLFHSQGSNSEPNTTSTGDDHLPEFENETEHASDVEPDSQEQHDETLEDNEQMEDTVDGEPLIQVASSKRVAAKKTKKTRAGGRGDASGHESDSSGEDLFGESMERDYLAHPTLDRYDPEGIDDQSDYSPMSIRQRQEAEKLMERRDRRFGDPAARRALLYGIGIGWRSSSRIDFVVFYLEMTALYTVYRTLYIFVFRMTWELKYSWFGVYLIGMSDEEEDQEGARERRLRLGRMAIQAEATSIGMTEFGTEDLVDEAVAAEDLVLYLLLLLIERGNFESVVVWCIL